ncbi:MAG: N-acetylgalactosamine-6-sulfatase [Planctomycetota bacterium]|nr:MAG: N-acetylgalactosamine-6-sulfatase [Planctomycetota bacterium]
MVAAGFACAALVGGASDARALDDRPNIIWIMADDLGYGDLSCYGQKILKTPNIDRLAREGMKFTQFYAGSTVCAPSRCVLMTGLHTGHCYIRGNGKINLRPQDVTVAEVLKAAGYSTALFGKWGLGHEGSTGIPTRQGFDEFFGYLDQHHAHNYFPTFLIHNERRVKLPNVVPNEGRYGQGVATVRKQYSHDLIMQAALDWLERIHADSTPFFMYLAVTLPHANNEARNKGMEVPDLGEFAEKDWPEPEKGFAAMIQRLDRDVGRLLERLDAYGLTETTVVFFTSDNGPHREGGHNPDFFDSNGPLRGIKRDLYEGGIRVPLLARWPGKIPAGTTTDFVGYFADFLPTAAELARAENVPPNDGVSFVPTLLRTGRQKQHEYLYWEFYEGPSRQAVRRGNWKAIREPMFHGRVQLYDLSTDIGEQHDLAAEHPKVVAEMTRLMDEAHVPNPLWKVRPRKNPGKAPAKRPAKTAPKR